MPRVKTKASKKNLLKKVRKQRLNYITVLPSLITILNCVCGFIAMILASKHHFALAGYLVLVAMIADMLDGRVARMSNNTSSFGGQLDSLCDVISFGVAPALIAVMILDYKLSQANLAESIDSFIHRFIWFSAAAYVSCAAIRLARFNVENEEDESAHMNFVGLPSPAAAGLIVSIIIFQRENLTMLSEESFLFRTFDYFFVAILPPVMLATAMLMVSRIRYPHVLNQYMKGKKPFEKFIKLLLALAFLALIRQTALLIIFSIFAASGFSRWAFGKLAKKTRKLKAASQVNSEPKQA